MRWNQEFFPLFVTAGFDGLTRGPYDLEESESAVASKEAAEFVATIGPWKIPKGHGTYRQKRPGLGVTIHGYDVDCSAEPHAMTVRYSVSAWRTAGETRFGDSILVSPNAELTDSGSEAQEARDEPPTS